MLQATQEKLNLNHQFDAKRMRHYLNGQLSVLHCHHYASLYTQLAIDAKETDLLTRVSEETFHGVLANYFDKHNVESLDERIAIACEHYGAIGLGQMAVHHLGSDSGEVVLAHSHVDEGWMKKWGKFDQPVNFIGSGYIAGMFAAIWDKPISTFQVRETQSIVQGAPQSRFTVYKA
ncbi:MAG TPA: hypothetical protein PKH24_10875 [Sedimentisphaerales bacterium]|jgi:hypothetical protein|nr:hypothetical protein [Sedimentisphaerales bacterium]HNU28575.1 hypothetical protein [Sedimentisphaerales bacterium]